MSNENYYVYCKGILGVRTNIDDFKWVYGSIAPNCSVEEYNKCTVKFNITVTSEKKLFGKETYSHKFQAYMWDDNKKILYYRRTMFSKIKIGYDISISQNEVNVYVGKSYLKLVQKRVMNLHGMYYLLSDIANMMLLKNGFLTLYASAVHFKSTNKGMVFFAPPNTGKTITSTSLCELDGCSFVGEDIVITDGEKIYACPWTSSYRKNKSKLDSAGSSGRVNNLKNYSVCDSCDLTDIMVLSIGDFKISDDKTEILRKVPILNGYLFHYFTSPIIKILGYFDKDLCRDWNEYAEVIINNMVDICNCNEIECKKPLEFSDIVCNMLGEKT